MRYMGGKSRTAKQIAGFINSIRKPGQTYWEPFVGAGWILERIKGEGENYASDANEHLIAMWKALQDGWVPPGHVSEEEYLGIKNNMGNYPPELVAFVGFGCSFGGKWFGGYARGEGRNWAREARDSLLRKMRGISTTKCNFACSNFIESDPPDDNCLIYCDPPYEGKTGYGAVGAWNAGQFWKRVDELESRGHTVIVSEYQAPPHFREVLSVKTKTDMNTRGGKEKRVERVFMLHPPSNAEQQPR